MNIENKKQFATILLAVGLGLIAVLLTSQYVQNKVQQQTEFLAKDFQKKNAVLINELEGMKKDFKRIEQDQAALAKAQQQLRVAQPQQAGAPVKPAVQMAAFSVRTPPGKRALTISIDSLAAVGGLVNPGDFVDVLAHLKIPENLGDTASTTAQVTTVLFQNIQVLAVGTNFNPLGNEPAYELQQKSRTLNVTLAVTPEEAGLLTFAQANGTFQLTLRAPAEESTQRIQVASWNTLAEFVKKRQGTDLVVPKSKAPVAVVEKDITVEVEEEEPASNIQIFRGGREL
ncbi:MAG TPA: Flp pilus assembly protein CpaB [Candidatus Omnitrophota bacterium]|nr:Flp pilus assembly protein CpaB [Candidatus Omnitrophota bacterium]